MKLTNLVNGIAFRAGLCGAAMLLSSATINAQETIESTTDVEMLETGEGAPIVISSFQTDFGDGSGGSSMRIVASGDGESGMGRMFLADAFSGMGGMGGGDAFSMLSNKSVQEDLELVGDQLDKVNEIRQDFDKELREQFEILKSDPQAGQDLAERIQEIQQAKKEKIEGMLLPHQLERLKQVQLQTKMQQRGTAATLASKELAEALGIDADQKKRIKKRAKELSEELAKRTAELKEEIRNKLLEELTSDQKAKLEELRGEKFEYKKQNIGDMIKRKIEQQRKSREEN